MDILTFTQLEAQGAQAISAGQLIFQRKKFRLGPAFAKRCHRAAHNFCRIAKAECLLVDHDNYLGIWLHYQKKKPPANKEKQPDATPKDSLDQILAKPVTDTEILELFETALPTGHQDGFIYELTPEFIESVKAALVEIIGPMGHLIIKKQLSQNRHQGPSEFIVALAEKIPNDYHTQVFLTKFFPN